MIDYDVAKINGDPQPPDEMNNMFAELKTVISSLGIAFGAGSTQQLAEAIGILAMIGQYYADTGTANTYVVGVTPGTRKPPVSYFTGMKISFVAGNASTGASTINVSGLGVKSIKQPDGTPIITGDIFAVGLTNLFYDGTNFILEQNPSSAVTGHSTTVESATFTDTYTKVCKVSVVIPYTSSVLVSAGMSALYAGAGYSHEISIRRDTVVKAVGSISSQTTAGLHAASSANFAESALPAGTYEYQIYARNSKDTNAMTTSTVNLSVLAMP